MAKRHAFKETGAGNKDNFKLTTAALLKSVSLVQTVHTSIFHDHFKKENMIFLLHKGNITCCVVLLEDQFSQPGTRSNSYRITALVLPGEEKRTKTLILIRFHFLSIVSCKQIRIYI